MKTSDRAVRKKQLFVVPHSDISQSTVASRYDQGYVDTDASLGGTPSDLDCERAGLPDQSAATVAEAGSMDALVEATIAAMEGATRSASAQLAGRRDGASPTYDPCGHDFPIPRTEWQESLEIAFRHPVSGIAQAPCRIRPDADRAFERPAGSFPDPNQVFGVGLSRRGKRRSPIRSVRTRRLDRGFLYQQPGKTMLFRYFLPISLTLAFCAVMVVLIFVPPRSQHAEFRQDLSCRSPNGLGCLRTAQ